MIDLNFEDILLSDFSRTSISLSRPTPNLYFTPKLIHLYEMAPPTIILDSKQLLQVPI